MLRRDEKEEKETFMCVCVERENFCRRRSRVCERTKGNRCDVMKTGTGKIMGRVAARVVRFLVHAGWKDKLMRISIA